MFVRNKVSNIRCFVSMVIVTASVVTLNLIYDSCKASSLTAETLAKNVESVRIKRKMEAEHSDIPESKTLIPKRLHQTFKNVHIPMSYHEHIRSWTRNHPDWEYYLWTDEDATRMIRERYPQFAAILGNYTHQLSLSDAIRYFVLHQYGGVYCDMDMRSLKPIESFLAQNSCIVVPEPQIQTQLLFGYASTLTNCIMASVPNHPFLDLVLKNLANFNRPIKNDRDVLRSTGPFFLNDTYNQYTKKYDYCRQGKYCHVYVSDIKYLVPTFDRKAMRNNLALCSKADLGYYYRNLACRQLMVSNLLKPVPAEAYSDHLWLHIGYRPKEKFETRHIEEIVPGFLQYNLLRRKGY